MREAQISTLIDPNGNPCKGSSMIDPDGMHQATPIDSRPGGSGIDPWGFCGMAVVQDGIIETGPVFA